MQRNWNVQFNSNNKIVKERIWIAVKLTIQNRVVKVDESNARKSDLIQEVQDYTCRMSKKSKNVSSSRNG